MYDYREAIKDDIRNYIDNEINFTDFDTLEELEEHLNDALWAEDSVTGNASGSYTYNRWTAREYVIDNLDLLWEAAGVFGSTLEDIGNAFLNEEWEGFDVTIRCYLLSSQIPEVLKEIKSEFDEAHETERT